MSEKLKIDLLKRISKDVEEARNIGVAFPELRNRMCKTMSDLIIIACDLVEN